MSKTFNLLPLLAAPPAAPELDPQNFVPFHILIADYLKPPMTPPFLAVGHFTHAHLAEVHAFNIHLVQDLLAEPAFELYPLRTGKMADVVLSDIKAVAFRKEVVAAGQVGMTRVMDHLIWFMRGRGALGLKKFPREDIISAFADPRSAMFDDSDHDADGRMPYWGNVAFRSLRTVMPAFKMVQLGIHMVVYEGEGDDMKLWIQHRGPNVGYPGMLDSASISLHVYWALILMRQTAGGAVEAGLTPMDALCREGEEECGYTADIIHKYAKCTGALPALNNGRLTNVFYELKRPDPDSPDYAATEPKLGDHDECAAFELMPIPQVIASLQHGKFQPVTPYKIVHFLIRHGFITKETDEQYEELVECLNSRIPVPLPFRLMDKFDEEGLGPKDP